MSELIYTYAKNIIGPVVYSYTSWVLREAQKRGIKRLYFLARDGFLPYSVAKKICEREKIDIDLRYIYVSRASLRLPTYHLMGEEMYSLLLSGGNCVSASSLFDRAGLDEGEKHQLCKELCCEEDKPLNEAELKALGEKIRKSELYRTCVTEKSREAYKCTCDYLRKVGLFDSDEVAIVDIGWLGTMQRSLRLLLSSCGYTGKLTGFYFGLFKEQKSEDGEYLSYYFGHKGALKRKVYFNPTLFECMLSAPHPMTLSYKYENDVPVPQFATPYGEKMQQLVELQNEGVLSYEGEEISQEEIYKLLKRTVTKPSLDEAEMYASFDFSDDITEAYSLSLVKRNAKMGKYNFLPRLISKLSGKKQSGEEDLLWPYSALCYKKPLTRWWYRGNLILWEYFRHIF